MKKGFSIVLNHTIVKSTEETNMISSSKKTGRQSMRVSAIEDQENEFLNLPDFSFSLTALF